MKKIFNGDGLQAKFLVVLVLFLLISGCVQKSEKEKSVEEFAREECISLCKSSKLDLSRGPCLSDDNPSWKINDWVCDVAHYPRQAIDNLPENQCRDFREGRATHFVEVDENCRFIRAV